MNLIREHVLCVVRLKIMNVAPRTRNTFCAYNCLKNFKNNNTHRKGNLLHVNEIKKSNGLFV